MSRSCCVVPLFAATLLLAASTGALAQRDPAALLEQHDEAINRGDAAGALALYADDAVIDGGGCGCPVRRHGRDPEGSWSAGWPASRAAPFSSNTCPATS